jgi:hypothetical protein
MAQRNYPAGALVRVNDICRNPKTGAAGILPLGRSTWYRWIQEGKVPEGVSLAGTATKVWPIETVLALAGQADN